MPIFSRSIIAASGAKMPDADGSIGCGVLGTAVGVGVGVDRRVAVGAGVGVSVGARVGAAAGAAVGGGFGFAAAPGPATSITNVASAVCGPPSWSTWTLSLYVP